MRELDSMRNYQITEKIRETGDWAFGSRNTVLTVHTTDLE
jgi:hypothetical protein